MDTDLRTFVTSLHFLSIPQTWVSVRYRNLRKQKKSGLLIKFFRNAFSFLMPMIVICVFRSFMLGHNKVRFSVVVWPDGGTCVVATKWLNESKETVVYPPKTKCFTRLVMSLVDVKEDWEECNVDFLHSYKTFNLASKAVKLAAEDKPIDSNIETDYEKPRKRQPPVKFQNQSSNDVSQSSDDDDRESENMRKKCKRPVAREPRREMQRTKSEEREKCQNVSQVNSVPAPAVNIREQLAALKAQVSHPIKASKGNGINSNTKRKVLTAKKLIKTVNKKVSLEKSQSEDILRNCGKSPADTENANATDFSNADLHASKNLCQSPLNTDDDMTSDSEMLPATQTSTESKISSSLHELGGERDQSEVFQSNNELSDSNDMQNLTEHRSAQQDLANRDNSVKRNTVKSFLRGSGDFSRKKRKGNDDKSTDRDVLDNIVKIQEECISSRLYFQKRPCSDLGETVNRFL
ncbi:uncharacterized protein LOC143897975 [Temnothorax americanus]|uniref:uncharacterized protein LOC143897975 n=1 Tax=Temnothorax americanus TaxID=1964332 RepID=UPI0040691CFD